MKESAARPPVLHEVMGMELLPSVPGEAHAKMAVTHTVCQPFGFLSGGALSHWPKLWPVTVLWRFARREKFLLGFR